MENQLIIWTEQNDEDLYCSTAKAKVWYFLGRAFKSNNSQTKFVLFDARNQSCCDSFWHMGTKFVLAPLTFVLVMSYKAQGSPQEIFETTKGKMMYSTNTASDNQIFWNKALNSRV